MSAPDINPAWKLTPIGRGSFALVSILSGRPVAFKHVLARERTGELRAEFAMLRALYDSCNTDSFFAIPRPLAYYDPNDTTFISPDGSPPLIGRRRSHRPLVTKGDFALLNLDTAAYAMDQVLPIPLATAKIVRTLFYPPNQASATDPTLCRLYFGKVIQMAGPGGRPNRFFNSANFPLDVARYRRMLEVARRDDCEYPSVEEIAHGMGEILGRMHWCSGYDGRDVEFIMSGASFSGVEMNVIDFNQMRTWNRKKDDIPQLVDAFFVNDPYYPRPYLLDPLYQAFRVGYMSAYPKELDPVELCQAFLQAIEVEQGKRSSCSDTN